MPDDPRLERIYEGIELVGSVGDPMARTMCIMSFVACLAGEGPTDAPMSASPVIRGFAIVINDRMPPTMRRRLKPFAPRIIGTNDGQDEARVEVLRKFLADDILPRIMDKKHTPSVVRHRRGVLGRAWIGWLKGHLRRRTADLTDKAAYGQPPGLGIELAHAAGQLISLYALDAAVDNEEGWYWGKAIDLLDRLCSVGAEGRVAVVCPDRLAWLERILAAQGCVDGLNGAEPTTLSTLAAQFPGIV